MCVIVDASCAGLVLTASVNDDFRPVRTLLDSRKVKIVHGGKVTRELIENKEVQRLLANWDRAGIAAKWPDNEIDHEISRLGSITLKSNDAHVLALARACGVRVLCANDVDLARDFTNRDIIDRPRGKVYQSASHEHLVRKSRCVRRCSCRA